MIRLERLFLALFLLLFAFFFFASAHLTSLCFRRKRGMSNLDSLALGSCGLAMEEWFCVISYCVVCCAHKNHFQFAFATSQPAVVLVGWKDGFLKRTCVHTSMQHAIEHDT